jgi:DNA polymerase
METFYSKEYSLSKMTTEEYIRDPRFQVIGFGIKVNSNATEWVTGTAKTVLSVLRNDIDWGNSALLAHNMMFDGAIMSWRCGIQPKALFDTLCMSRAIYGTEVSHSLKAVAERHGIGEKGDEVVRALGKRRLDFIPQELAAYGKYCVNDVDLCYKLFQIMSKGFPPKEMRLIDLTLRMFTDPVLEIDADHMKNHLAATQQIKEDLLTSVGVDKKELMSNPKFAELLKQFGVTPPMKISPTTGKSTYAFAKTDPGLKELQEHDDSRVQTLVAARLGTKSTLEESRTQRFIDIASRGKLPAPIRYYAAHTGRWGGDDKINLQNLPSRGPNAKKIKKGIMAPDGYILVDCDSSQIEARVLAWLAGQDDLTEDFLQKRDVYKKMAGRIYNIKPDEVNDFPQRFLGKTTILGAGYNMGGPKFQTSVTNMGLEISADEAQRAIDIYRKEHMSIEEMSRGFNTPFGKKGVLEMVPEETAIRLPSGLLIRYEDLQAEPGDYGYQYTYKVRRGRNYIYGGKCVENVVQGIARCIVGEQMIKVAKRYRVALTVHDSIVPCVREEEVDEAREYIETCMSWAPDWAEGLPVACESNAAERYGDC